MTATTLAPAATAAAPRTAENSRARQHLALGLLASAQFVVMLDTSIVNVALP